MSVAERLRRAAQRGRQVAADVGQRDVTVALEVTTVTTATNDPHATTSASSTLTLTPAPKVRESGPGDPSWFGGGVAIDAGADLSAEMLEVGPITEAWSGGGYAPATLYPAAGSATRVVYRLSGGKYGTAGQLFKPVGLRRPSPQSIYLLLQRTRQ